MKKLVFGLGAFCCLAAAEAAPSWVQVGGFDKNVGVTLVEVDSIHKKGNQVSYWKWVVFPEVWGTATGQPFDNAKSKNIVDCTEKLSGSSYIASYLGSVNVSEKAIPLVMKPIIPGSVGMAELNAVCNMRLPGKAFDTYEQIKASFPIAK